MDKPYIVIHTHTSIDGNLDIMDLPEFREASRQYQELALSPEKQQLDVQGYLNGKTSTEDNITHYRKPELDENASPVPAGDYVAVSDAPMYYLSIDGGEAGVRGEHLRLRRLPSHIVEVRPAASTLQGFLGRRSLHHRRQGSNRYEVMLDRFYHVPYQTDDGWRRRNAQLVVRPERAGR